MSTPPKMLEMPSGGFAAPQGCRGRGGGHSSCAAFRIQPKSPETPGSGRPRGLLVAGRFRALVSFAFVQSLFFLVLFFFFNYF